MRRQRLRVALVFGGRSGEHDVSVVSARSVVRALDHSRYEVVPMAIDRHGLWAEPEAAAGTLEKSGDRTDRVVRFTGRYRLDPRLCHGEVDVVFPVLHGPWGEDGTIQGLCEILGIPYVGCDVSASAVCMDKALCKRLLAQAGLPTPAWVELDRQRWDGDRDAASSRCLGLGLPLFVKPARLGSSVGISKVTRPEQLPAAMEHALAHDHRLVVETGVDAREIEVAVLGNELAEASLPGEVVPGHEFYDYEDKYVDDTCQLLAPAPLDQGRTEAVRSLAIAAYRSLGCQGMARVDLFLRRSDGEVLVNEVNTIPGFTSISMYPRLWTLTGLTYQDLVERLIRLALQRHEGRRRTVPGSAEAGPAPET